MNRIVVSVLALILVIIISTIGVLSLNSSCKNLAENLDEVKQAAIDRDREKSIELTQKVTEIWEKEEKKVSLLVDHREIDEIEQTIKSLSVYARQDNMEKLEEKSSIAAERVRHIRDKEKLSPENIF